MDSKIFKDFRCVQLKNHQAWPDKHSLDIKEIDTVNKQGALIAC